MRTFQNRFLTFFFAEQRTYHRSFAVLLLELPSSLSVWIRQVFTWPHRVSPFPTPTHPAGVYGERVTYDVRAYTPIIFDWQEETWRSCFSRMEEWHFIPLFCNMCRMHWGMFAIFIWGWRVVVKGPERGKAVMDAMELKRGGPGRHRVALLGKSCLPFAEEEQMCRLVERLGSSHYLGMHRNCRTRGEVPRLEGPLWSIQGQEKDKAATSDAAVVRRSWTEGLQQRY
jgi:hypothetical protein